MHTESGVEMERPEIAQATGQTKGARARIIPREDSRVQPAAHAGAEATPGLSVKLLGLRAFYGQAEPVKGIDLEFRANEVTAIIGPSGCGKSTLVRCINRM